MASITTGTPGYQVVSGTILHFSHDVKNENAREEIPYGAGSCEPVQERQRFLKG
jgi:hypothetical protein